MCFFPVLPTEGDISMEALDTQKSDVTTESQETQIPKQDDDVIDNPASRIKSEREDEDIAAEASEDNEKKHTFAIEPVTVGNNVKEVGERVTEESSNSDLESNDVQLPVRDSFATDDKTNNTKLRNQTHNKQAGDFSLSVTQHHEPSEVNNILNITNNLGIFTNGFSPSESTTGFTSVFKQAETHFPTYSLAEKFHTKSKDVLQTSIAFKESNIKANSNQILMASEVSVTDEDVQRTVRTPTTTFTRVAVSTKPQKLDMEEPKPVGQTENDDDHDDFQHENTDDGEVIKNSMNSMRTSNVNVIQPSPSFIFWNRVLSTYQKHGLLNSKVQIIKEQLEKTVLTSSFPEIKNTKHPKPDVAAPTVQHESTTKILKYAFYSLTTVEDITRIETEFSSPIIQSSIELAIKETSAIMSTPFIPNIQETLSKESKVEKESALLLKTSTTNEQSSLQENGRQELPKIVPSYLSAKAKDDDLSKLTEELEKAKTKHPDVALSLKQDSSHTKSQNVECVPNSISSTNIHFTSTIVPFVASQSSSKSRGSKATYTNCKNVTDKDEPSRESLIFSNRAISTSMALYSQKIGMTLHQTRPDVSSLATEGNASPVFTNNWSTVIPSKPPIPTPTVKANMPCKATTITTVINKKTEDIPSRTIMLPAVYIIMTLGMTWKDYCDRRNETREELAHFLTWHMNDEISPSQIVIFNHNRCQAIKKYEKAAKETGYRKWKPVNLLMHVTNTNHKYDGDLTELLGNLLMKDKLHDSSLPILQLVTNVSVYIKSDSIYNQPKKIQPNNFQASMNNGPIYAIAISSIAGACLVVLCILLVIMKQRLNQYNHNCTRSSLDAYSLDSFSISASFRRRQRRPRLSLHSFLNHAFNETESISNPLNCSALCAFSENKEAMEKEFKSMPMNMPTIEQAVPGSEVKNRYANIIPVPETRVVLACDQKTESDPCPSYINANYVRGYGGKPKKYIACQAPLPNTVSDFWRMVWEQDCRTILMLTLFEENEMSRCEPYFPENTVEAHKLYGDFQISLQSREDRGPFIISTFRVHELEKHVFRDVIHLWFTSWPPKGVVTDVTTLLHYLLVARPQIDTNPGPTVVHCSSGTGRTGVVLALDICMREIEETNSTDILRCVLQLRQDRGGCVQNIEQYFLLYEALREYALRLSNQSHRPSLATTD